ncbi:9197_t:CDS:2 [Ambispora gerdemannii]|uniref:Protein-lysine N-methyltransferase EFM4 n=1 Tax=Ambispora gerdemannii TaxID=144530 RepID=A0A9N9A3W7_9GLOM|nr:9197_t:CDS:2 [Ambispora gerdemannii]
MNPDNKDMDDDAEFGASELGIKEYWDSVYARETRNFIANGDIGEIWFGEKTAAKMVNWILKHAPNKSTKILDLGCGNGHILLDLASHNYTNLTGIDYSPDAIELAKSVSQERGYKHMIEYHVVDLLSDNIQIGAESNDIGFDIVLDKGTYDAISMNPEIVAKRERGEKDSYPGLVKRLLSKKSEYSIFLITSCNWTKEELVQRFGDEFDYHSYVEHPTFTFGGITGQTISTVAFKLNEK